MKYWFFDGSDVTGPFALKELTQNKSFNASSLVCPENFSDDGDHWQVAATFDDFKSFFTHTAQPDESTTTFEQEMNTLLKQSSPLLFDETPSDGPRLQIPKKPAKPGPIEDYFNQIKEEDLGDILGIPNPNEDSDMDLAQVLEKQLAKTSSTRRREREQEQESEIDRQTADELKSASQTHHVATATEVFTTKAPLQKTAASAKAGSVEKEPPTMPVVESPTMPVVATPAPMAQTKQAPTQPAEPEELVTKPLPQAPQPQPAPVDSPQPKPGPHELSVVPAPSQLRREKVEVNSIRTPLKQTQEMQDFLHETASNRLQKEEHTQKRLTVMMLMALAIIGGVLLVFQFHPQNSASTPAPTSTATAQELLAEPEPPAVQTPIPVQAVAAVKPPQAAVQPQTSTQEQKALEIVQNHPLSGQRGTLSAYLNRIYKNQLAQGYTGTWGAEPLYKNTYIVKYRLTKTRKEPIIYVFQADVAQGKLTGALNNISLDLVGKL